MKKKSRLVDRNAKELSESLGLSHLDVLEWEVRYVISQKIIDSCKKKYMTVTEIAKRAGTSRGRVTKILKNDTFGISLDVLVRVLGALGEEMKISFKKAA